MASQNNINWPPKSPLEALLSSPKGKQRWQEHRDRITQDRDRDISPSPRKQPPSSSKALQDIMAMSDDNSDDDEEILQLQLQAIQAKLKLKKLQRQKSSQNTNDEDSRPSSENSNSPRKRQKTHSAAFDPAVQVTVSPIKSHMPPPALPDPTSPARVRLGIDKGLKAADVSLKRARNGSTLSTKNTARTTLPAEPERPKQSFSERIAANRLSAEQQQAKYERIEKARSQGFGLAAQATPRATKETTQSRPQLSRTQSDRTTRQLPTESSTGSFSRSIPTSSASQSPFLFSSLHLSKRKLPHTTLARALDGKEVYTLPRLLKEVVAPIYEPPSCETDFVVLAVIASKSSPFDTRPKHKQTSSVEDDDPSSTKFMVMTLTDLHWEVDLFLFDTAFEAFWKMTPGTVIAILNPSIMPPKTNQHSGKFSLKLASSEDSVMEIGSARDLGFCTALKKDGKECHAWVNTRKTKFCDFHIELAVNKTRASRMEVNTMYHPNSKDYESNERYFMVPGSRTTASLLDQDDYGKADALRRRLKDKEKDRLLAEKLGQMGNGIGAEYLRTTTGAPNASRDTHMDNTDEDAPLYKPSAAELGLVNKNASQVRLSPAKDRRKLFSVLPGGTKTTAAGPEAMGWGGHAKRGLGETSRKRDLSPEKGQTRLHTHTRPSSIASPKKARFQLAKGIREPGRDSLDARAVLDDSSDDLEII
ncbi:uncharacterized protein M437DRAFT_41834 [Aureobasidium melanogenum CBS 110374]|uniref:Uncharacterized protein n=1 Tax=Aureobasidium melanogenum (strain CBS 110374) TaxID=1043003 RepID=A0A074W6X3_AURM1|nr:uncharacterized protein M437DRAFT_41834 [Aureobasidium melanogenum CBS 110374]KEQ65642.1 hypothetical protein M437DRAFT_41834 [Aureobasidium melanogenum CBS 110374]